jgi:hypothetical protein
MPPPILLYRTGVAPKLTEHRRAATKLASCADFEGTSAYNKKETRMPLFEELQQAIIDGKDPISKALTENMLKEGIVG